MKVIMVSRFGAPEVLRVAEVAPPVPGDGQLAVAVSAVGVGWLDARIRAGGAPPGFAPALPYVPGSGVAGTVTAVGAGVADEWLGATVVTRPAGLRYGGGYAEVVVADPGDAVRVPDGVDVRRALAVLDDGSTAIALVERTPVGPGDRVVVAPGLGGLGSLLVQLARSAGAEVVAAVRGDAKVRLARRLGVRAVDYGRAGWTDALGTPDVVFDGLGGSIGAELLGLLGAGGRFSGYGMSSGAPTVVDDVLRRRVTVADMSQLPEFWPDTPRRVRQALGEVAAGRLSPVLGRTYPLVAAAAAHADIEARNFVGKLLLVP